jgi:basic membrane protein A
VLLALSVIAAACGDDEAEPDTSAADSAALEQAQAEAAAAEAEAADAAAEADAAAARAAEAEAALEAAMDEAEGAIDPDVVTELEAQLAAAQADAAAAKEEAEAAAAAAEEAAAAAPEPEPVNELVALFDANGDGEVRIGIAAQGPRDDGGYYEAVIAQAEELSELHGFGAPIIVDNITFEEAAVELDNLANQPVDIILVGASGIGGSLGEISEKYPDIYWYCNCGAGLPPSDFFSQTQYDNSDIAYTGGVAMGILLQERGGDSMAMIGCCDLGFEKEVFLAFELGLKSVDPDFTMSYTPTGDFPFDFNNTANATIAFDAAVAAGADAINPYLGGALEPIARLGLDAGLIVTHPGSSTACGDDIGYDMTQRNDGGDFIRIVFPDIVAGNFPEGTIRVFTAATDPDVVGGEICGRERPAALQAAYDLVASGELDDEFGAIKGQAYASG